MYNDCGREKISHITFCKKVLVAGKLSTNDRSNQLINCQTQTTPLSRKRGYKRNPQVRTFNSVPQRLNLGTNMFIHHITFISAAGRVAVYDLDDWPKEGCHYPDDAEIEVQWRMNQFHHPQSKRLEQALRTLGCGKRTLQKGKTYTTWEKIKRCGHLLSQEGVKCKASSEVYGDSAEDFTNSTSIDEDPSRGKDVAPANHRAPKRIRLDQSPTSATYQSAEGEDIGPVDVQSGRSGPALPSSSLQDSLSCLPAIRIPPSGGQALPAAWTIPSNPRSCSRVDC